MNLRRFFLLFVAVVAAFWLQRVSARVAISEVMWAGSDLSTADEWIEISGIGLGLGIESGDDLSGWVLTTRKSNGEEVPIIQFASGTTLETESFLLISNYDADHSRLSIDPQVITTAVALPNTKLQLKLYDASGALMDVADDSVGAPMAGTNASGTGFRASMERIRFDLPGDIPDAWATARTSMGLDDSAPVFGTPGFPNYSGSGGATSSQSFLSSDSSVSLASFASSISSQSTFISSQASSWMSSLSTASLPTSSLPTSSSQSSSEPNTIYIPKILITEVLANPIGRDDHEWIEIGNVGTGSVNIAGWILDEGNSPDHFVIPAMRSASGSTGFVLKPSEHIAFSKSVSGLPLDNGGEELSLFSGSILIDRWSYPATAEQVSYGRSGSGSFRAFCIPTESAPNEIIPFDVIIGIQSTNGTVTESGAVVREKKVSINLEARSASGSLASAVCSWNYGDGFISDSCNPPSHSIKEIGIYEVKLVVTTFCGETVERVLGVEVEEGKGKEDKGKGGGGVGAEKSEPDLCIPTTFSNIRISEFLANPYGDEKEGEWIELINESDQTADLCGWSIDDEASGSKPYSLDGESIQPHGFLVLPREQTKIALNNDGDRVRLFAPVASGAGILIHDLPFERSTEGESLALRDDGHVVWTPYPTPGGSNKFRSAERRFATDTITVAAALPNPAGKDGESEWIEIANVSDESFELTGWLLDNKDGGSPPFSLDGIQLKPDAVRRFTIQETGITLVNSKDVVRILDPDRYVVSIFGWTEAVEERIYRRPVITTERASARVINVVDGDTIDIELTDPDQFKTIPPSLKRRWLGLAEVRSNPAIRVRMIGIDTPETVHPTVAVQRFGKEASNFTKALLQGQEVGLEFDAEIWDKYNRLLAYVHPDDGDMAQRQLLRNGFAYAYLRFPFLRADEFAALEGEARAAKLGMWSDDEVALMMEEMEEDTEEEKVLEEEGLTLTVEPPSGRVASGTLVTFIPSVTSDLFLSVNSGSFTAFSGSYVVTEDVDLVVYAERGPLPHPLPSGEGRGEGKGQVLRTEILTATYLLERAKYDLQVTISEVYPSPNSGEEEWIEITNSTSSDVQLGGWILDDVRGEGSRPWIIPGHIVVPSSGSIVLKKEQTGLTLNNDGDEVWLLSPDGQVAVMGVFGKVKKGRGVVFAPQTGNRELEEGDDEVEPAYAEASAGKSEAVESVGNWMAALLWGTKLINIPAVHPRRQREAAEELSGIGIGLGLREGEEVESEAVESEEPQIISRITVACLTDEPTPGTQNICIEYSNNKISKKSQKKAKKPVQKKYSKASAKAGGMRWLKTKYENVFPWMSEEVEAAELPESHRYLASFLNKPTSQKLQNTSKYPTESIVLIALCISAFGLLLKGSRGS